MGRYVYFFFFKQGYETLKKIHNEYFFGSLSWMKAAYFLKLQLFKLLK